MLQSLSLQHFACYELQALRPRRRTFRHSRFLSPRHSRPSTRGQVETLRHLGPEGLLLPTDLTSVWPHTGSRSSSAVRLLVLGWVLSTYRVTSLKKLSALASDDPPGGPLRPGEEGYQ